MNQERGSDSRKEQSSASSCAILIHCLLKLGDLFVSFAEFFRSVVASSTFQAARSSSVAVSMEPLLGTYGGGSIAVCDVVGCFMTLALLALSVPSITLREM